MLPDLVYDIQHVTKYYPGQEHPANDDISLQIHRGEIFGLLGDNGAGKSTLVRQMANLIHSTSGQIKLLGKPVDHDPWHVPLHIGYMPQEDLALNNLTVGEAIYFTAHLRGLSRKAARVERDWLLESWQMEPLRDKSNMRLSGGQKRLLRIAVALAGSPPVLILDEPTSDLDPQRRSQVWEALRALHQEQNTTVIFITHDAIEAEKIIQRVGILRRGALVALGKPSELKKSIDQKLRLDLFFPVHAPPVIPLDKEVIHVDAGHWRMIVDRREAGLALNSLDMSQVDDFRLYSATLEDLYLYYAQQDAPA